MEDKTKLSNNALDSNIKSSNLVNSDMMSDKTDSSEYAVISGSPGFSGPRAAQVLGLDPMKNNPVNKMS